MLFSQDQSDSSLCSHTASHLPEDAASSEAQPDKLESLVLSLEDMAGQSFVNLSCKATQALQANALAWAKRYVSHLREHFKDQP